MAAGLKVLEKRRCNFTHAFHAAAQQLVVSHSSSVPSLLPAAVAG